MDLSCETHSREPTMTWRDPIPFFASEPQILPIVPEVIKAFGLPILL